MSLVYYFFGTRCT